MKKTTTENKNQRKTIKLMKEMWRRWRRRLRRRLAEEKHTFEMVICLHKDLCEYIIVCVDHVNIEPKRNTGERETWRGEK